MRCPDCNKFTSKDTDTDPEGELEVTDDGQVQGDVRIVNTCADCGTELEETTFSVELDFSTAVEAHIKAHHVGVEKIELSLDSDITRTDEYQMKDRSGKPIANPRYRKHYYGIVAAVTCICDTCERTSEHRVIGAEDFSDHVQASGMESMV